MGSIGGRQFDSFNEFKRFNGFKRFNKFNEFNWFNEFKRLEGMSDFVSEAGFKKLTNREHPDLKRFLGENDPGQIVLQ